MNLTYKVISRPGEHDKELLAFFVANDHEFVPPIAERKELTLFVQSIYDDKGKYVLCYDGDKIVGLTTIIANHPNYLYYYQYVAVDKNYRHLGIAARLYDMVTEICKKEGVLRSVVKTWSLNKISQDLFPRKGFYHAETIEDHRSKGVHSYFYFISFAQVWFRQPLTCLCIIGRGAPVVNFIRTLTAVTKNTPSGKGALPYIVVSAPGSDGSIGDQVPAMASHLMFTDLTQYLNADKVSAGAEVPDMLDAVRGLVDCKDKKWLLAGADIDQVQKLFNMENMQLPDETQLLRVRYIVDEIARGFITPAYYKEELAAMARECGCKGLLLAAPELHTAFGFDRQFNDVEIFDPLVELTFIIQNNWIGKKDQE